MKKIITITLFALICFGLFGNHATASQEMENNREKAVLIEESLRNDIDAMRAEVDDLVKRIEAARPRGTREEQRRQYFALDMEIDKLDDLIDLLEDRVKADYVSGVLTWEEYRGIDRELDRLEERLDRAEDRLEKVSPPE